MLSCEALYMYDCPRGKVAHVRPLCCVLTGCLSRLGARGGECVQAGECRPWPTVHAQQDAQP